MNSHTHKKNRSRKKMETKMKKQDKMDFEPNQKVFDNNLVAVRKSKVTLKLNKLQTLECVFRN